jgi:hypothetical protein
MIDNDHSIGWLRRQVQAAGVTITQRRIDGRLSEQEDRLRAEFRADAIVNTGLGRCPDSRSSDVPAAPRARASDQRRQPDVEDRRNPLSRIPRARPSRTWSSSSRAG